MKHPQSLLLLSLLILGPSLAAQTYRVGDIVDDWTFTDYRTGNSVSLYELGSAGGVLVLEWFAFLCPFQGGARPQSDTFIQTFNLGTVLEDYSRSFFNLFSPSGGQPLFVIINAEENSPTADRWEVLYTRLNYFTNEAPDISALMRPVIDSVEPGVAPDPVRSVFANATGPVDGWYESSWLGWFNAEAFPNIFHVEHGFGRVLSAGNDSVFLYTGRLGWTFSGPAFYPFLYSFETGNWLYYQQGSNGLWFYDYALGNWRSFN